MGGGRAGIGRGHAHPGGGQLRDMLGNQSFLLEFPSSTPSIPKFFGGGQNRNIGVEIYCWSPESNFYRSGVTAGGRYMHHVELMASKTI